MKTESSSDFCLTRRRSLLTGMTGRVEKWGGIKLWQKTSEDIWYLQNHRCETISKNWCCFSGSDATYFLFEMREFEWTMWEMYSIILTTALRRRASSTSSSSCFGFQVAMDFLTQLSEVIYWASLLDVCANIKKYFNRWSLLSRVILFNKKKNRT